MCSVKQVGGQLGKSGWHQRRDANRSLRKKVKWLIPSSQEKPLARTQVTVPQTDAGRWEEDSKAIERTMLKELGKISP